MSNNSKTFQFTVGPSIESWRSLSSLTLVKDSQIIILQHLVDSKTLNLDTTFYKRYLTNPSNELLHPFDSFAILNSYFCQKNKIKMVNMWLISLVKLSNFIIWAHFILPSENLETSSLSENNVWNNLLKPSQELSEKWYFISFKHQRISAFILDSFRT